MSPDEKKKQLLLRNTEDIIFNSFVMYLFFSLIVTYVIIFLKTPIEMRYSILSSATFFLIAPMVAFFTVRNLVTEQQKRTRYYVLIMVLFYTITTFVYFNQRTHYTNVLLAINLMIILSITMKRSWVYLFALLTFTILLVSIYLKEDNIIYYTSIGVLLSATYACTQVITRFKAYVNNLVEMNTSLEIKVEERTVDLSAANQELIALVEDLHNTQDKLVEVEKMASLGKVVAGVAHKMNTPIGVSVTAISFLKNEIDQLNHAIDNNTISKKQLKECVNNISDSIDLIKTNTNRAVEIIDEFKKTSPYESDHRKKEVHIKDIIDHYLKVNQQRFTDNNIEVIYEIEDIVLYLNPENINDILFNLVDNAIVHGFSGLNKGTISLHVSLTNKDVLMQFFNNGHWIKEEDFEHIYDPFFTTRHNLQSTGIGLNIIHSIVTGILDGHIQIENKDPAGVLVTIRFPQQTK